LDKKIKRKLKFDQIRPSCL